MANTRVQKAFTSSAAGSAVLATEITGYNTEAATQVTTAKAVANVVPSSIKIGEQPLIMFDGTNYIVFGSINYLTT